ncbi:sodium:solute symporter family transporter, partial [Alicyclobacillus acidocaldarius]|uniref:sodium:solute symporter family transporter n=1 Tax=Alicyclobacillus acidocaldarius TaxID=405212 RepID=UPI003F53F8ED
PSRRARDGIRRRVRHSHAQSSAVLGFVAARWRRGDLSHLEEWGLAGRRFGTLITWFLVGGDLYTAYTFIAVPGLMYGKGALGFYAVPYTTVVYPIFLLILPRFWSVARSKGYVTASDFVQGRYGDRLLSFAVALTGIVATIPYIALQLTGMQAVITAMGIPGSWPLISRSSFWLCSPTQAACARRR